MKPLMFFITILPIVLMSCGKDNVDTTKPVIELIQPTAEASFHPGDTIQFECVFSDNVELQSYNIKIHSAADEHEHLSVPEFKKSVLIEEQGHEWSYEKSRVFEKGLKEIRVQHIEIIIPEAIQVGLDEEPILPGHYHFGVFCIDGAGNESFVFVEIEIGL
jgi:hypothetical protein